MTVSGYPRAGVDARAAAGCRNCLAGLSEEAGRPAGDGTGSGAAATEASHADDDMGFGVGPATWCRLSRGGLCREVEGRADRGGDFFPGRGCCNPCLRTIVGDPPFRHGRQTRLAPATIIGEVGIGVTRAWPY